MLTIKVPISNDKNKIEYICNYIFKIRLNLLYKIDFISTDSISIINDLDNSLIIGWQSSILNIEIDKWHNLINPNDFLYKKNNGSHEKVFPIFSLTPAKKIIPQDSLLLNFDLFSSIFYILTRAEEIHNTKRDNHNRFPYKESIIYKYQIIDRPIVDEYIEFISDKIIKKAGSNLLNYYLDKKGNQSFLISCDVDSYNYFFNGLKYFLKLDLRSLIEQKEKFKNLFIKKLVHEITGYQNDPHKKGIDKILSINQIINSKPLFFFIPKVTNKQFDSFQTLEEEIIKKACKKIQKRGCDIGCHPGYDCYNNKSNMKESVEYFSKVNHMKTEINSRMHYLRWDVLKTPEIINNTKINIDHSQGFAEHAGFRCGTSNPFKIYDIKNNNTTNVIAKPLIAMECSLISNRYQGIKNPNMILSYLKKLINLCHKYGGTFSLLWHNSHFTNINDDYIYYVILNSLINE